MRRIIKIVIEFLSSLIKTKPKPVPGREPTFSRNERLLVFASNEIGVKEVEGSGDSARVKLYHAYAREDNDLARAEPDSTAWCASFLCYCLEMVGMGSTNSMLARSFLKWGVSTRKHPLPGDLVVLWRGKRAGWTGHCGVYLAHDSTHCWIIGGNQANQVSVGKYPLNGSRMGLLDYRRSSKSRELSKRDIQKLRKLSGQILAGNKVELSHDVE